MEDHFIQTLDMLYEVKQSITDVKIQREIQRIDSLSDHVEFYDYTMQLHRNIPKPFMNFTVFKRVNSINYRKLVLHKVYDNDLINIGHRVSSVLYVRTCSRQQISLDILDSDYSKLGKSNKFQLFMILCVLAYMVTPLDELGIDFIRYNATINILFKSSSDALIQNYMRTDDMEFIHMGNVLLLRYNKIQLSDLMQTLHNSYKANRFYKYIEIPNLFELCSYNRTPDDGYNIKCINRTYQLASLTDSVIHGTELELDMIYSSIGSIFKVGNNIYTQLIIDFHKHIYEKEIDIYKLHKLIMVDEELTPLEREYALMLHRAVIKHHILRGGITHKGRTIIFKDIIPDMDKKCITAYNFN